MHALTSLAVPISADRYAGVMNAGYARARDTSPVLQFRLKSRAWVVARAWNKYGNGRSPRVLDMGAAEGRTLVEIARQVGRGDYVGVEMDAGLIAAGAKLSNEIRLVKGDVCALPDSLEQGSFDAVSLLAVLEHLSNPVAALREAMRMLRAGGLLIATCPNPAWDRVATRLGMVRGEHHVQQLNLRALRELVQHEGFEIVDARRFMWAPIACLPYLHLPVSAGLAGVIDRFIHRVPFLKPLCVNAYVVARKPLS